MIDKGQGFVVNLVHRNFSDEQEAMAWLMEDTTEKPSTSNSAAS